MKEPPELELKDLPSHLEYAFLEENDKLPVIIAKGLKNDDKDALLKVLKSHKRATAWKITDIKGIDPRFCTHKILLEDDYKPTVQSQRWVNPKIHEVIKKEVLKLFDAGIPIPIDPQDQEKNLLSHARRGMVLGHNFKSGIEVDRAKVDVFAKLTHLDYRYKVLLKEAFRSSILGCFGWNLPFELCVMQSDFAIGAVLRQRKMKHFQPIHYASKTMTEAQIHYYYHGKGNACRCVCFEKVLALSCSYPKNRVYGSSALKVPYEIHDAKRDFMGPFLSSRGNKYILIAVDYLSKWVEAKALPINDARVVVKFLKSLFARFDTPRAIISDRGTHFCIDIEQQWRERKEENRASWSDRLDDALWAFRTAYKTPIGCTPYKLVYGKSCHLPIELEHRAYWALKHANFDLKTAGDHRKLQLNELNELHDQAYENSLIYKERTKKLHDSKIKNRIFNVGDQVLLFNSRLKIFSRKLKT
ncbi:reverse transcriptase domain-containing protein [Tanacetum coccineum]|uniref:Reverse transcriptase domain-containing protein n=1 Tax=Tanacetum coccineum TaxID=301880 RepID=A0ABQ4YLM9_9ASTR